ncbi:MAG: DNA replication/repair protein RecF, partial [Acidimicrobiia bacterium]
MAWLELARFRSYRGLSWEPAAEINLLVGPNGAGKTNLLEAIGYLAALRSFRSVPDEALITMGAEAAVIRGEVLRGERASLVEVEVPRAGRRRVQVNRHRPARSSDLLGVLRVVTFLPEDLDLVKRGSAHRRDFLDQVAVQLWPTAHLDQQEYERALRQRNSFLRQVGPGPVDSVTLAVWDERLSQAGGRVMARRA